jgi:hypothetical protein
MMSAIQSRQDAHSNLMTDYGDLEALLRDVTSRANTITGQASAAAATIAASKDWQSRASVRSSEAAAKRIELSSAQADAAPARESQRTQERNNRKDALAAANADTALLINTGTMSAQADTVCSAKAAADQAAAKKAATQAAAVNWTCVPGYDCPMRINSDGDTECMSLNNHDCMWGGGDCQSKLSTDPGLLRPLACGAMHQREWGGGGYDIPTHWCHLVAQYFDKAIVLRVHDTTIDGLGSWASPGFAVSAGNSKFNLAMRTCQYFTVDSDTTRYTFAEYWATVHFGKDVYRYGPSQIPHSVLQSYTDHTFHFVY